MKKTFRVMAKERNAKKFKCYWRMRETVDGRGREGRMAVDEAMRLSGLGELEAVKLEIDLAPDMALTLHFKINSDYTIDDQGQLTLAG